MDPILLLATNRPDGPSWTPYVFIGGFVLVMIFVGFMFAKKRR
ncbi:hypothetical protein [Streptomyces sp. NPDC058623]